MTIPNVRDWLEIAYRRRNVALLAALSTFAVIALGTLMWAPVYSSSCEILVQGNRAELLVTPGLQENTLQNPGAVANAVSEQELNSERELLTSMYLVKLALADLPVPPAYSHKNGVAVGMMKSVLKLPVSGYGALHDIPKLEPREKWALDVEQHLGASVIKRSNIIEVEYRSDDRHWTKTFLDRLIMHYMEFHAHISHDPAAQQFFEGQKKQLEVRLEGSEEKLRDFQLKTGIGNLSEQKHNLINRISELQRDAAQNVAGILASDRQVTTIEGQLKNTPERINKETRTVQNQALQQLKPQVAQLKAERAELLSRYQPNSQRIKQIDAKLAEQEKVLNSENRLEVNEQSFDTNPIWLTLETQIQQARTTSASRNATLDEINRQIATANQQLSALVSNGVLLDRLQRQVTSDQDTYRSYVRKTEEARAAEALNADKILNVSLAQPPVEPLQPIFPSVPLNLAVGMLLAFAMGIAAAYWAEERDPTIYSASSITEATGLPIIAVVSNRM
jgi:uncharacterized protein involved in exopolysaccharide biosynthesis